MARFILKGSILILGSIVFAACGIARDEPGGSSGDGDSDSGAQAGSGGSETGTGSSSGTGGGTGSSAGSGGSASALDCSGTFSDPRPLMQGSERLTSPGLTGDKLQLIYVRGEQYYELFYLSERASPEDDFESGQTLPELNEHCESQGRLDKSADISADGLRVYFNCYSDLEVLTDLFVAERPDRNSPFGAPRSVAQAPPSVTTNPSELILFGARYSTDVSTFMAQRADLDSPFSELSVVPGLANYSFFSPGISPDLLEIYGTVGSEKVFSRATRDAESEPFRGPEPVALGQDLLGVGAPDLSPDCRTMVYAGVNYDQIWSIYQAER